MHVNITGNVNAQTDEQTKALQIKEKRKEVNNQIETCLV